MYPLHSLRNKISEIWLPVLKSIAPLPFSLVYTILVHRPIMCDLAINSSFLITKFVSYMRYVSLTVSNKLTYKKQRENV